MDWDEAQYRYIPDGIELPHTNDMRALRQSRPNRYRDLYPYTTVLLARIVGDMDY